MEAGSRAHLAAEVDAMATDPAHLSPVFVLQMEFMSDPFPPYHRTDHIQVIGSIRSGELPELGARVSIARWRKATIVATVVYRQALENGNGLLVLSGVSHSDVYRAYALSTSAAALAEVEAPAWVRTGPTEEDEYADYGGPPLRYGWGHIEGVDVELVIELGRLPSDEEKASLERAIQAWDVRGTLEGFGGWLIFGRGTLHGLYEGPEVGPRWEGSTFRWLEDFGLADARAAANDLARRLAGWSARWSVPIVRLQFGS
ncbi:MAG: hypothetical protein HY690_17565 [Chloroflexi bacterium]|nr:hypothetical protein [Chloroflexota bacterium]